MIGQTLRWYHILEKLGGMGVLYKAGDTRLNRDSRDRADLPAFFGPPITGEQRQSAWLSRSRVLLGQREPASPASAHRHPSQHGAAL